MKILTTVLLLLFSFAAVAADSDETKTVQSKDKCIQVTLPKGWEATAISEPSPTVQARCIAAKLSEPDAGLIVISEPKSTYHSLKEMADVLINSHKKASFEDIVVTEPRTVKVNGQDALQFGFHGTRKKSRFVAISSCIESSTRWNCIQVFTTQSQLDKVQDQIDAITKSFKELPKEQQSKESPKNGP